MKPFDLDRYLHRLAALVNIDTGTGNTAGLDRAAGLLAGWCREAQLETALTRVGPTQAPLLTARMPGRGSGRVLLVGHLDTVFADGEAARRPWHTSEGRAYGPGVCDDKAGVLSGLSALEMLADDADRAPTVTLVVTPDEETGAMGSRPVLARLAADADAALCLECARENGDLVNARKGVADVAITLTGRAAHAGIEPERGANAALAAAELTVALQRLNGRWPQVSVNVGVLRAGNRPNVVPDSAELLVDLRGADTASFTEALRTIESLAGDLSVAGVTSQVEIVAPAPPWRIDDPDDWLTIAATRAGTDVGVPIRFAATGGSADANLLASYGIAVLDGLGPIGGGDHAPHEWLDLASIQPRIHLLTALIRRIAERDAEPMTVSPEAAPCASAQP